MTWADAIRAAIRSYVINSLTSAVVTDIANNGLNAADEAIVDAFLAQTMP
jgi:hypothetical protein